MAEESGFYTSDNGDREYEETFLADMIASIIKNGVYDGELGVAAKNNMSVTLPPGRAWINGRFYHNDADLTLNINNASGTFARYSAVMLRADRNTRQTTAVVVDGAASSNPTKPVPTRTSEIHDLVLAYIKVKAGATKIEIADIEDTRLEKNLCGIVSGVVEQIDSTTLYTRLQADIAALEELLKNVQNDSAVMLKSTYDPNNDGTVEKAKEGTDQTARNAASAASTAASAASTAASEAVETANAAAASASSAASAASTAATTAANAANAVSSATYDKASSTVIEAALSMNGGYCSEQAGIRFGRTVMLTVAYYCDSIPGQAGSPWQIGRITDTEFIPTTDVYTTATVGDTGTAATIRIDTQGKVYSLAMLGKVTIYFTANYIARRL